MSAHKTKLSDWVCLCLATTFFTGFLPGKIHPRLKGKGGGLMGSIVALLPLWFLWNQPCCNNTVIVLITAGLTLPPLSTWIVKKGEMEIFSRYGPRRRHTGETVDSDFNETNIDEVIGMFWAAICIWPLHGRASSWWLLAIFVVFRILDTAKPWPISFFEKEWKMASPAFSVIIDDAVAGVIAGMTILFVMHFFV